MRAVWRALKPLGRFVYYVITFVEGISDEDLARVTTLGSEHVHTATPYPDLMHEAGFVAIGVTDVTDVYLEVNQKLLEVSEVEADDLIDLMGEEEYRARRDRRETAVTAIKDGLRKRYLISAVKP